MVVLDLNLPGEDGMTVLKTLRKTDREIKVLILSARCEVSDKVAGLDAGANDYLTKPFHLDELAARIRSLTLRRFTQNDVVLTCSELSFDVKTRKASVCGEPLSLTRKETGILEYLMLNQGRPISQEELLEHVTERMSQMTKILLEMSALRTVPCNDTVELSPMLEEILTDLAPLAEKKGVTLSYDGDGTRIGSDTLLYRMIFNLTENAIRYNRCDAAVHISICDEADRILIRVKDHGFGIAEQYRESIFQPFFRVDKSRSRAHGGVGLGLSLVWEIASLHGGTVKTEESSENGTVMLVTLQKIAMCKVQ